MAHKARQTVAIVILVLGLGTLLYGLNLSVQPVFSESNDKGLATRESDLVLEASRGGIRREADGTLHKTYEGKPPQACPD